MSKLADTNNPHPVEWPDVEQAIERAAAAFHLYQALPVAKREAFLRQIATEMEKDRGALVAICHQESHLPVGRLESELDRTIYQIQLFADLLHEGSWVNAIIDTAVPERIPVAKPDIRQMQIPLGPVCVYGASNFPFAFSVVGGDTVSALAAGCPVLYKVHPNQPKTAHLTAACVTRAMQKVAVPAGVFSALWLKSQEIGLRMVAHPMVKAVGFTGSYAGGSALYKASMQRADPIPVYAEMSSINPVFVLPGHLDKNAVATAKTLVASNVLGAGQFCTNPGLIALIASESADQFIQVYAEEIKQQSVHSMLTAGIYQAYSQGIVQLQSAKGSEILAQGVDADDTPDKPVPTAVLVKGSDFLSQAVFRKEYFGPASVVVLARDKAELLEIAKSLDGQLTASMWCSEGDMDSFAALFHILEEKVGRLIVNAVPTGVEVGHAMMHGGPYPATMDGRSTSVGTQAIYRFTRPMSYQNYPEHLLPVALRNKNEQGLWRLINGDPTKEDVKL